jgi:hypothetical protein
MLKSLIASTMLLAGSAAFAAPSLNTVVDNVGDAHALRSTATVCVGNLDVDKTIAAQYRYGDEGDWTQVTFEKNVLWQFSVRYPADVEAPKFAVKFLTRDGTDAPELSYDLAQTETWLRPAGCDNVENYRFQKTDAPELTVDLVHVGQ